MPEIETARLRLRPMAERDLDDMARLWAEPAVMRYLPTHKPRPREATQVELDNMVRHWRERGFGSWAVTLKDGSAWAGYCLLQYLHEEPGGVPAEALQGHSDVEVGYGLLPAYWGQGIATEAARAAVRYAFEVLALPRVVAAIDPANAASRRILQKAGLKPDSTIRYYGDCPHFSLAREAYQPGDAPWQLCEP